MLKAGEVDVTTSMHAESIPAIKSDPKAKMGYDIHSFGILLVMTEQWDPKSPWSDVRVRKAASLAVDRKSLAEAVAGPNAFFPATSCLRP